MIDTKVIALLIPARNEADALPLMLAHIPSEVDRVLVIDNGSTDATGKIAAGCRARVITEPIPGYGRACLKGLAALSANPPDIVAFADADGSDDLSALPALCRLIADHSFDLVLACRVPVDGDALTPFQVFGNWLATRLIDWIWHFNYRDLGPMRAVKWDAIRKMNLQDQDFGWTVEMQIKAVKLGMRIVEQPSCYHRRIAGRSKVSGTFRGAFKASLKILWVIARQGVLAKND